MALEPNGPGAHMKLVIEAVVFVVVAQSPEKGGEDIYWAQIQLFIDTVGTVEAEVGHLGNVKAVDVVMVGHVEVCIALPYLD